MKKLFTFLASPFARIWRTLRCQHKWTEIDGPWTEECGKCGCMRSAHR